MLWETINEESCDINMDCSSFPMPHNQLSMCRTTRLDMAIEEELSFYNDDDIEQDNSAAIQQHEQRNFNASPELIPLLSPEGSPQRFRIIEQSVNNKFLQPVARQQKLRNNNSHFDNTIISTKSSNTNINNDASIKSRTPAKGFRVFHSLSSSSSVESSIDDEYMELFQMESLEQQIGQANLNFPSNLNSLISGKIKSSNSPSPMGAGIGALKTPEMRRPSVRRCLSMTENNFQHQPKTPELLKPVQDIISEHQQNNTPYSSRLTANIGYTSSNCCFKRPEPPHSNTSSPVQSKRYRTGDEKENLLETLVSSSYSTTTTTCSTNNSVIVRPPLRKCMSMNDAEIMSALARSESKNDLIGDFSKPFVLPLMEGRHRDLKSVSSDTVAHLINGHYNEQIANYIIVDCRYPYEYEGGHIRGAKNLYTHEQIIEEFLTLQKTEEQQVRTESAGNKRNIIIFHCEFSSERGPKLSRFLRNNDRARNTNSYPSLDYPEIYLLHNGYKEFFEMHAELCDPNSYRPMLEPSYSEAYRHFRAKSKSWNGDGLGGGTASRVKKSRSRLML